MEVNLNTKFEEIYNSESDNIFRFCFLRVSNREIALDLTQEVFLRFWKTLESSKNIDNYKAFLFTIARRLIIDWYRKKKSLSLEGILERQDSSDKDLVDKNSLDDSFEEKAEGKYLVSKLKLLKEKDRDIIQLRFISDLSPGEIGKVLGISTNAASVRINRALSELKKVFGIDIDRGVGINKPELLNE